MEPARVSGTVTIEQQRAYIKIETLRGKTPTEIYRALSEICEYSPFLEEEEQKTRLRKEMKEKVKLKKKACETLKKQTPDKVSIINLEIPESCEYPSVNFKSYASMKAKKASEKTEMVKLAGKVSSKSNSHSGKELGLSTSSKGKIKFSLNQNVHKKRTTKKEELLFFKDHWGEEEEERVLFIEDYQELGETSKIGEKGGPENTWDWVQSLLLSCVNRVFNRGDRVKKQLSLPFKEIPRPDAVQLSKSETGGFVDHISKSGTVSEEKYSHSDDRAVLNLDGQLDMSEEYLIGEEEEGGDKQQLESDVLQQKEKVLDEAAALALSTGEAPLNEATLPGKENEPMELVSQEVPDKELIKHDIVETRLDMEKSHEDFEEEFSIKASDGLTSSMSRAPVNRRRASESDVQPAGQENDLLSNSEPTITMNRRSSPKNLTDEEKRTEPFGVIGLEKEEVTDERQLKKFVDFIIETAVRKAVTEFVQSYVTDIIRIAQETAIKKVIADEMERNDPDACNLSEFRMLGVTKESIRNQILRGLYFPLHGSARFYFGKDPEKTLLACYDYMIKYQYSKIDVFTLRMLYKISLAGLNSLTKLCINFGYLADGTGETLLSIGAIREGNLIHLKLLCLRDEVPSISDMKYDEKRNYDIPDIAWRKAKFLCPLLRVHLVMFCVQRYNLASTFIPKHMPLESVHISTGYRGVRAGLFVLWYFDYTLRMLTFYPHTLKSLSFYIWHSRERLDNLVKRMLAQLINLDTFEYYGTLQYLRTMDEICLFFLRQKTVIKRLALFKIEDPCEGTKLRMIVDERKKKYAPLFEARNIMFDMGTFCL